VSAAPETGEQLLELILKYGRVQMTQAEREAMFSAITAAVLELYVTRERALSLAEKSQAQAARAVTMVERLLQPKSASAR
jgi:hypothetical protein